MRASTEKQKKAVSIGGLVISDLEFPEWQGSYMEALMETDQGKLVGRIDVAERKIFFALKGNSKQL